jgi:hypothetical protein
LPLQVEDVINNLNSRRGYCKNYKALVGLMKKQKTNRHFTGDVSKFSKDLRTTVVHQK